MVCFASLFEEVSMHTCPLCHNQHTRHYFEDKHREYLQCEQCYLVFVNPDQRLDAETEKA
ncbi:methyltransferase, partial [Vibrio parahaemolyticus]